MDKALTRQFPPHFVWGIATAAYQIEGAWNEDGRAPSIWDTFSHTPGKIERNENGDVASDHYHRWETDLDLMVELGIKAYRFSISWPRVIPLGNGTPNPAGLDFYDRLVDGLLARGIEPFVTLYHWDLPQALQDRGGWTAEKIVIAFGEYTRVVAQRLGDRIQNWITLNEPMAATLAGHFLGIHAPGIQNPLAAFKVGLNLLRSHGLAVQVLRATARPDAQIGITLNLSPVHPASDRTEDQEAAQRFDLVTNRVFLEPVLLGTDPEESGRLFGLLAPRVSAEQLALIAQPIDFLGVNYYTRSVIGHDPSIPLIKFNQVHPEGNEYSQMWEIYPEGLYEILDRVWQEYLYPHHPEMDILITENGICVPDGIDSDGHVRDERRIRYLQSHLDQVWRSISAGMPVKGYFCWSFMDNFEWSFGYRMRFGLVYVDFENQRRILKHSGLWYRNVIQNNAISPIE